MLQILWNMRLRERNINRWGNSYNTVSFSQHRLLSLTPSFHKQAGTSSTPLCESILTPHCQQEPIHIPPSFKQSLLLCSPQLAWLSLSQQRARLGVGECFVAQIKELKQSELLCMKVLGGSSDPNSQSFRPGLTRTNRPGLQPGNSNPW